VLPDDRAQAHPLEVAAPLLAVRLPVPLGLLVLVPPIVHDLHHGRLRGGRHLDQVELGLLRPLQRGSERQDADLLTLRTDHPDFAGPDAVVDAWFSTDPSAPSMCVPKNVKGWPRHPLLHSLGRDPGGAAPG